MTLFPSARNGTSPALLKKDAINYLHFPPHVFYMFLFLCINISAYSATNSWLPSGHFVHINHPVTLKKPKMAFTATYHKYTWGRINLTLSPDRGENPALTAH